MLERYARNEPERDVYVILKSLNLILRKRKMTRFVWYKKICGPYGENKLDGTQRLG